MLRNLRVSNFAILSDVAIEFGEGMNVLTGETGAGKSLIVDAVNLLRGGRASADIPRTGAEEAVVEAIVEVPPDLAAEVAAVLQQGGLPVPDADEAIIIRRVIQRGGRSRTYINGALTTASRLAELGRLLIDLSGQHEHQGLVDAAGHLRYLDTYSNHAEALAALHAAWTSLDTLTKRLTGLTTDDAERARRLEFVRYQAEELAAIKPSTGEDVTLEQERVRLASVAQLAAATRVADDLIYASHDSAYDRIAQASKELERAARLDPTLKAPAHVLQEAQALIDEAARTLRQYTDKLEADPERLTWVEERLAALRKLARKHGGNLEAAIAAAEAFTAEISRLEHTDDERQQLEADVAQHLAQATKLAAALSLARQAAGAKLGCEATAALADLAMTSATLSIRIEPRPLGPSGIDHVEFVLESNRGEAAKPLSKIASGGELSRIMLALKMVLRAGDAVATYVFDEVDTGIGGSVAHVVGEQIRTVAAHRQVICVTHLPQIAAFADHHFHVAKHEEAGRTETTVARLSAPGRKEELARMLSGHATAKAKAHAAELLEDAKRRRAKLAS